MTDGATNSQKQKGLVAFAAIAVLLAILLLFGRTQFLTGDEPRYLMYAVAFWKTGSFSMTLPDWQRSMWSQRQQADIRPMPSLRQTRSFPRLAPTRSPR